MGCAHKGRECFVLGHGRGLATQQLGIPRQHVHVPAHELARADLAGVIERVQPGYLGTVAKVARQELIADVEQ